MVRQKKICKRLMACAASFCLMFCSASPPVFAYTENMGPEEVIDEIFIETVSDNTGVIVTDDTWDGDGKVDPETVDIIVEALMEEADNQSAGNETDPDDETGYDDTAFSVPGNGTVLDDVTDESTKEFFTITTANNNTFFLVIDRSGTRENVYMLSMVDETDLQDFVIKTEDEEEAVTQQSSVVLEQTIVQTETAEQKETEEEEDTAGTDNSVSDSNSNSLLLLVVIIVAGCGGTWYYFRVRRAKQNSQDSGNEGIELEYSEEDLPTVNEDNDETDED